MKCMYFDTCYKYDDYHSHVKISPMQQFNNWDQKDVSKIFSIDTVYNTDGEIKHIVVYYEANNEI